MIEYNTTVNENQPCTHRQSLTTNQWSHCFLPISQQLKAIHKQVKRISYPCNESLRWLTLPRLVG